jgi:hypothetical protein
MQSGTTIPHRTTNHRWPTTLSSRLLVLICLLTIAPIVFGQGVSGRILGTVQDKSGAVVARAAVAVTNQGTGITVNGKTDSNGQYRIENLQPGNYSVKFSAPGFRPLVSVGNVVVVDGSTRIDTALEVGSQTETIEVTATAALVDTTSSSLSQVVNEQQIENLPLNGRIFSQLSQIVPGSIAAGSGSAPESAAGAGATTAISASVNGLPWAGTTYTLDGVNNMELLNAFINVTPPLDSLQEVKVSSNNADATVGTYGGAQVNAIVKSGTNSLHGSGYEFFRSDALNAYQWRATTKAPYRSNQFGGSFGGPIIKNRAFFFADYQGLLLNHGISYILTVPTDLMKQGTFLKSQFPNAIYDPQTAQPFPTVTTAQGDAWQIPTARFDSVSAKAASGTTIWPTATNQASTSNNFQTNTVEPDNSHQVDIKGDYQFTNGDRIFVRESYQRRDLIAPSPGTQFIQIGDVNAASRDHNAAIGFNHIFSPTTTNEVRVGLNRFNTSDFGNDRGTNENSTLGIPNGNDSAFGATGMANLQIGNIVGTGSQGWTNAHRITNAYELTDNFIKAWGRHTLTVGEDYRLLQASLTNSDANKNGDIAFSKSYTSSCTMNSSCSGSIGGNEFASFLLGLPSNTDRGYVATHPATRATLLGAYAQDQYRVNDSLTLNLALRWDIITPAIDKANKQGNFDLVNGVVNFATPSNRAPNVDNFLGGYSPRVGFAYTPNKGATTVSGAFGITHFPQNYGAIGGFLERSVPFFETFTAQAQFLNTPLPSVSVTGLPSYVNASSNGSLVPPPGVNVAHMIRNYQPDAAYSWNFGVQQKLTNSMALSVTYVGTRGVHLFRRWNLNTPPPGTTAFNSRLPYQYFNQSNKQYATYIDNVQANGSSIYHAMQAQLKTHLQRNLEGNFSFTWSKEIDDMNMWWPLNDRYNRAVGNSQAPDVPRSFIGSFTYQLPFGTGQRWMTTTNRPVQLLLGGWQVSSITILQAGQPMRIKTSTDVLGSGVTNSADQTCSSVKTFKSVSKWFDTSCFATPQPLTLGNAKQGDVRGPGYYNSDFSLSKSVEIREGMRISFQADAFNLANTPHYSNPDTTFGHSNFGVVGGTNGAPREIQLGTHFSF